MSIEPELLILLIGIPIIGGAFIVYAVRKHPEWKKPIVWALTGILCFELARQVFGLFFS